MAYEVVIPRLGLTMEEGRVLEWYKSDGEVIEPGEPLFSVETDKVVLDVEAAVGGIVQQIPGLPDEAMPIGTPASARAVNAILRPLVLFVICTSSAREPPNHPSYAGDQSKTENHNDRCVRGVQAVIWIQNIKTATDD